MAKNKVKKAKAAKAAETAAAEPASGKRVEFTPDAWRFYTAQSEAVKSAFADALSKLETDGRLAPPQGKPIAPNLYEIRVKVNPNQYRLFYCYFDPNGVLVLSGFVKKTQKTPQHEIDKAKRIRGEALK
ncbi:MAG: type II toxin-antitoxin system RelE/ParE family toxin [Kiritimatiellae bacterium]|nr:type II toxin-antitoxin system RelE/ParE family toxin [Kiritimatiellia bacterium]